MKNTSLSLKNFFSWFEMNPNECDDEIMKKLKDVISDKEGEMIQKPNQNFLKNENDSRNNQNEHFCIFEKCKKKFVTSNELKDHYLLHMTSKSFKCEFKNCEKVYKSRENLVLHIKNIHMKLKPYRCRFCDGSFSHRNGKIAFIFVRKDLSRKKISHKLSSLQV
jgi:uncharacterized Zn-finger protein